MFLLNNLKSTIQTGDKVDCPVLGCERRVDRQPTNDLKREPEYYCPDHRIYISPSTFEYEDVKENLLWADEDDLRYLEKIMGEKRESRMARERSEDALTWNVFRYLQKQRQLTHFVRAFTGYDIREPELVLWSYSPLAAGIWKPLREAREAFCELKNFESEPDVIIDTEHLLMMIEVKFTSTNYKPAQSPSALRKYKENEVSWYDQVFTSDIEEVSISQKLYELMRFWLLGTWMAQQLNKDFVLLSLTPRELDRDLMNDFTPLIVQNERRTFRHSPWEEVRSFIYQNLPDRQSANKLSNIWMRKLPAIPADDFRRLSVAVNRGTNDGKGSILTTVPREYARVHTSTYIS